MNIDRSLSGKAEPLFNWADLRSDVPYFCMRIGVHKILRTSVVTLYGQIKGPAARGKSRNLEMESAISK